MDDMIIVFICFVIGLLLVIPAMRLGQYIRENFAKDKQTTQEKTK